MEPKGSLPHLPVPSTCHYNEHAVLYCFFKINFNVNAPMLRSCKWSFHFRFPHQNPLCISLPLHTCNMHSVLVQCIYYYYCHFPYFVIIIIIMLLWRSCKYGFSVLNIFHIVAMFIVVTFRTVFHTECAVTARSKAWVCGRLLAGIVSSNPAGGTNVCPSWMLCVET